MAHRRAKTVRTETTTTKAAPTTVQHEEEQRTDQAARQTAQQASQQAGQSDSTIRSAVTDKEVGETGFSERYQTSGNDRSDLAWLNAKRTYDEYQQESLSSIRENRQLTQRMAQNAVSHDENTQAVALQALQNAVETANMIGKRAVTAGDVATDNMWNPMQQGAADTMLARAVSIDDASLKAIGATVASALAQALSSNKA